MNPQEFERILHQTLSDEQLSRGEKHLLGELLTQQPFDEQTAALLRAQVFAVARASVLDPQAHRVLGWLEDIIKLLVRPASPSTATPVNEAYFSPGDNCPARIAALIAGVQQKLDICVFTITDDRLANPLLTAQQRGVAVRIISDNEKLLELGSDIERLSAAGIPVKVDRSPFHMHNKFALFDDRLLLTGSYNWTRSAADSNQENFIVTSDAHLLQAFRRTFERLWKELTPFR